jgi:hypothetical protein
MSDLIFERDYAREMLLAAIKDQIEGGPDPRKDLRALIEQALNAGCDREEIIIELALAGAQLFARSTPDNSPALAHDLMGKVACRTGLLTGRG